MRRKGVPLRTSTGALFLLINSGNLPHFVSKWVFHYFCWQFLAFSLPTLDNPLQRKIHPSGSKSNNQNPKTMNDFSKMPVVSNEVKEEQDVLSFDEIKELYGSQLDDNPAVYCGTYGKYAGGSLYGLWLDITKFDDYYEFLDVCRQLHADEEDPELMFQDFENFPRCLYSESCMDEDTFNKIVEYAALDEDDREAFDDYIALGHDFDIDSFHEAYQGQFDTEADFADYIVSECYDLDSMMGNLSFYFDYEKYARDLFMDGYDMGDHGHVFRSY